MDNGNDQQRQCRPAKECVVELAKTIHWDDGKGKREKKERGGGSISVGNDNDAPSFVVQ